MICVQPLTKNPVRKATGRRLHFPSFPALSLSTVQPGKSKTINPSKSPFNPEIRPFNVSYFTCRIRPCYRSPCTQLPPSAASPLTLLALLGRCTYRGPAARPRSLGVPLSISLCRLFVFILLRIASPANPLYSHPYKSPGGVMTPRFPRAFRHAITRTGQL